MTNKKKRKKPSLRFKRMKRYERLQSARAWLISYDGKQKNIANKYRKRYGVGWECAFKELAFLGVKLDTEYVNTVLQNLKSANTKKKANNSEELEDFRAELFEQDENYAFIAGFTPGGVPYGITWDEWEDMENSKD